MLLGKNVAKVGWLVEALIGKNIGTVIAYMVARDNDWTKCRSS